MKTLKCLECNEVFTGKKKTLEAIAHMSKHKGAIT